MIESIKIRNKPRPTLSIFLEFCSDEPLYFTGLEEVNNSETVLNDIRTYFKEWKPKCICLKE